MMEKLAKWTWVEWGGAAIIACCISLAAYSATIDNLSSTLLFVLIAVFTLFLMPLPSKVENMAKNSETKKYYKALSSQKSQRKAKERRRNFKVISKE